MKKELGRPTEEHSREAVVHGRYLLAPAAVAGPRPLLVGFHGYAEGAESQLARLAAIPGSEGWHLAAVQGLHAFYNRRSGEVVASWMTRQNRELAIADNLRFVGGVLEELQARCSTSTLVLAGFSQGVAMAYRAAAFCGLPAAALVVLAADVPPDVAAGARPLPPVLLARGFEDYGYSAEKMGEDVATLHSLHVDVETFTFDGGHEWSPAFAAKVGEWLAPLLAG